MPQLVLAIEPDLRQAAIVKRIIREKGLADVAVVDSRDAALEAMRTSVPDVLLLSTLLSPRDEHELIAHLRTLEHAEHLQTHTIPQLASSIGPGEEKRGGLLSAFKRRKGAGSAPAGCDPDLFAQEIVTYLQRASEKKREVRDTAAMAPFAASPAPAPATKAGPETSAAPEAGSGSSWSSPFEWRPAAERDAKPAERARPATPEPQREPEPAREPIPAMEIEVAPEPELAPPPAPLPAPAPPRVHYPLIVRTANGWWFLEGEQRPLATEPDSEMREVLASLAVPAPVAAVGYAQGCRIRRVRLADA